MQHHQQLWIGTMGSIALLSATMFPSVAHAQDTPVSCQGKAVTIVATQTKTMGTEGDDVVAMAPYDWNVFNALGGNDTICLAPGASRDGRDPHGPTGRLDAGPGDDSVSNLSPTGMTGLSTNVILGRGNDTFQGAEVGEVVYAEDYSYSYGSDGYPDLTGAQTDVITGASTVFTGAPRDGANKDRIIASRDLVALITIEGPLAPEGLIDVSAAKAATLAIPLPATLRGQIPGEVEVSNERRTISAGSTPVVTWTGSFTRFLIGRAAETEPGRQPTVSFFGTDAAEAVAMQVGVGEVRLGGGNDELSVQSHGRVLPRGADGGTGADTVRLLSICNDLVVASGGAMSCDDVVSPGPLSGFEDLAVEGLKRVALSGTAGDDRLRAGGEEVHVVGKGGDDHIVIERSVRARVSGGAGADALRVTGGDVVARGMTGRDFIKVRGYARAYSLSDPRPWRQVVLGGPGNDRLLGTKSVLPDRLVGGRGRDRANGRAGARDFCIAEIVKRCERP